MTTALSAPRYRANALWTLGLVALVYFLVQVQEAIAVAFVGLIIASALLPWSRRLERRRLPRWASVLLVYLALILLILGVVGPVLGVALEQLQSFAQNVPGYLQQLRGWLGNWEANVEGLGRQFPLLRALPLNQLAGQWSNSVGQMLSGFTGATVAAAGVLSRILLNALSALVLSFYLLLDRDRIGRYLLRFLPPEHHSLSRSVVKRVMEGTGGFVNGLLTFMTVTGSLTAIGLTLIGLPFPVLLGLMAGLLTTIPLIGPNLALAIMVLVALTQPDPGVKALWVVGLSVLVQANENNVLNPLIMSRAVGLHPIAILLSILCGGLLLGLPGVLLAIPTATVINILIDTWLTHTHPAATSAALDT